MTAKKLKLIKPDKERKVGQILHVPAYSGDKCGMIYVVCTDGSLWWKNDLINSTWQREAPIPID